MSRPKWKRHGKRKPQKKACPSTPKAVAPVSSTATTDNGLAATTVSASTTCVAANPRPPRRRLVALGSVASFLVLAGSGYWLILPTQEQANQAKQANDRTAGRLDAKTEIVDLLPTRASEELKPLDKVCPEMSGIDIQGNKLTFVSFPDVRTLCRVNPRVLLKNTGKEVIEAVQIHVEEICVTPLGPYSIEDPRNGKKEVINFKPTLDPTQTENCVFAERFKPGDEAIVPIWRPLLKAMMRADVFRKCRDTPVARAPHWIGKDGVVAFPKWNGTYHGSFHVHLGARAVGATGSDRAEKGPIPLGFIWSAQGFSDSECKRVLDQPMAALRVATKEQPIVNVIRGKRLN